MYELICICRSLAAEKQNVPCVCVRHREREREGESERIHTTFASQVLLLFHKWENGSSEEHIWPSSNRYVLIWDTKLVLSGFEIYSFSTLSCRLLGNQLPRLEIQTYVSKLVGSHEPSETGLAYSALSLKVNNWSTWFFSKEDTGSLNPPSTLPPPVQVTFHFPAFTWINIQMIISEVQRNFQEELLISLNNIFFLAEKEFLTSQQRSREKKCFWLMHRFLLISLLLFLTFA